MNTSTTLSGGAMVKEKHAGGRPPKHTTKTLKESGDKYFVDCQEKILIPNKAGLMLWLDISRETYSQYRKQFPDTIRAIDNRIEQAWIQKLGGPSATGPIFYLKNAFKEDYKDKHETDITSGGEKLSSSSQEVADLATKFDEFFKGQQA